jgi:hypothetical protein
MLLFLFEMSRCQALGRPSRPFQTYSSAFPNLLKQRLGFHSGNPPPLSPLNTHIQLPAFLLSPCDLCKWPDSIHSLGVGVLADLAQSFSFLSKESDAVSWVQVFINRDNLDFGTVADLPAVQEWDLLENVNGQMEYPTQ